MITERHLDRAQQARELRGTPLPALLLQTGSMTGPHRTTSTMTVSPLLRIRRAVRGWLINRKGITL